MGKISIQKLRPVPTAAQREACADKAFKSLIEGALLPPDDHVVVLRPSACPRYIAKPWREVEREKETEFSPHMDRACALERAEAANTGRYWNTGL